MNASPSRPLRAPRRPALAKELRTGLEFIRLPLKGPSLARAPRGDGSKVLVIPGFATTDVSTRPVRTFLRSIGWDAVGWGLGRNTGDVEAGRDRLLEVVDEATRDGSKIAAVGWSLGGALAREMARERPDAVRRVVTFGTPLAGGPRYTTAGSNYDEAEIQRIEALIAEAKQRPIAAPITAIYSRNDGIVAWRACLDDDPRTEMVEVSSSHVGMGIDPDVWRIVAKRLAR